MAGFVAWFFLGAEKVGSVRGITVSPWGGTRTARVSVRQGGASVRIYLIGGVGVMGVWLTRPEALRCADALEKAAHEAVS
jgi:hypothetical protein